MATESCDKSTIQEDQKCLGGRVITQHHPPFLFFLVVAVSFQGPAQYIPPEKASWDAMDWISCIHLSIMILCS